MTGIQDDDVVLYAWIKGLGITSFFIILGWLFIAFASIGSG